MAATVLKAQPRMAAQQKFFAFCSRVLSAKEQSAANPRKQKKTREIGLIPPNVVTDKRGFLLFCEQALTQNIMPAGPLHDLCFDTITTHRAPTGNVRHMRVQVRSTCQHAEDNTLKFPILRSKRTKEFYAQHPDTLIARSFRPDDIDAFAFVQPDRRLFFIVPASFVDFTKTKFVVRVGDRWQNAWHHLKVSRRAR